MDKTSKGSRLYERRIDHVIIYRTKCCSKNHYAFFCLHCILFDHSSCSWKSKPGGSYESQVYPRNGGTISKRVVSRPMEIKQQSIPATYKTVTDQKMAEVKEITKIEQPTDSIKIKIKKIVEAGGNKIQVMALKSPS